MNARYAVFAVLSFKPHTISELIEKLPYSNHTLYKTIEKMVKDDLVTKSKVKRKVVVALSKDYSTQKLREIFIKALVYGIDPEILTRDSSLTIWKQLESPKTIKKVQQSTGLSYPWVRNIINYFVKADLVILKKRKPMVTVLNSKHELNKLIREFTEKKDDINKIYYEGTIPFERLIKTPSEIEAILFQKIDSSLTIKGTGFTIRGKDKLSIVESVDQDLSPEMFFLREIKTLEGVEDFCIRLIAAEKLNYYKLFDLAKNLDMVNIVGCYLNIINDLKTLIPFTVVDQFKKNISKKTVTFLKSQKKYGKSGWEGKYEDIWKIDLYLDLDSIRHGVSSI